jgi:AcrR family transcriptional regulator
MRDSRDHLRRRLQDIALELYLAHGFERTTTAEIAGRAGVTERTFFRYFADKREVLFDEDPRLRPLLMAAMTEAPDTDGPLETVLHALRSAVPLFEENRAFVEPRVPIIAATTALKERADAKTTALTILLAEGLVQRGVESGLATLAARAGMAAFSHAVQAWYTGPAKSLNTYLEQSVAALRTLTA